jgi:hypothetical protein
MDRMDPDLLLTTAKYVHQEALRRFQEGKVRPHLGTRGFLVLLLDKIDRILSQQGQLLQDELVDASVDALYALHFTVASRIHTLVPDEEDDDEEPEEDYEEESETDDFEG